MLGLLGEDATSTSLEVGDVMGRMDTQIRFVLERKTLSDFNASLKDGRIKSQRDRMRAMDCSRILLIERMGEDGHTHDPPALITLMAKDAARHQEVATLSVCCAVSTVGVIRALVKHCQHTAHTSTPGFVDTTPYMLKPTRVLRGTPPETRGLMALLLGVEGIGRKVARVVCDKYTSIRVFVRAASVDEIAALPIADKRCVGPVIAERLWRALG